MRIIASKSSYPGVMILLVIFLIFCSNEKESKESPDNNRSADSLIIELSGRTGVSIFDLTQEAYKVEYVGTPMGIFVKSIDSVPSNGNFGWLCSVNDSFVQIAVDAYITDDTDVIKWHYKKF